MLPASQSDCAQGLARGLFSICLGVATIEQGQFNIFLRRRPRQEIEALKDKAQITSTDARTLIPAQCLNMDTFEQISAGGWRIQTAQNIHGRRFARTAGTHDGNKLAFFNLKADLVERHQLTGPFAIALGHPLEGDQRTHGLGAAS